MRLIAAIVVVCFGLVAPGRLAGSSQNTRGAVPPLFQDVTAAAGIQATHINGASPEKYFAEISGREDLLRSVAYLANRHQDLRRAIEVTQARVRMSRNDPVAHRDLASLYTTIAVIRRRSQS